MTAARTRSRAEESLWMALLAQENVPRPEREYKFHPNLKWRFDFAWPDLDDYDDWPQPIALEMEGGVHRIAGRFDRDVEKYNEAQLRGWLDQNYDRVFGPHVGALKEQLRRERDPVLTAVLRRLVLLQTPRRRGRPPVDPARDMLAQALDLMAPDRLSRDQVAMSRGSGGASGAMVAPAKDAHPS